MALLWLLTWPVSVLVIWPLLWLAKTLLSLVGLALLLTILWRTYRTQMAGVRLPVLGWPIARQLRPIQPTQVVLITGATSGIGLALSKHLLRAGYSIMAAYYDSREPGHQELKQLAATVNQARGQQRLLLVELDVRDQESIGRAYVECERLLDEHKLHLYALVNNAGLGSLQPFAWLQRRTIKNMVDTNLLGNLMMTREFLPLLMKDSATSSSSSSSTTTTTTGAKRASGRILFVSSGLAFVPGATYATYGITKSAQVYLAKSLNFELEGAYGVKCVAMVPHNFIKNTNICSTNVKQNELAWAELKPIERDLFGAHFHEHVRLTKSLDEATKDLKAAAAAAAAAAKAASNKSRATPQVDSAGRTGGIMQLVGKTMRLAVDVRDCLSGVNNHLTLEESGALECFEAALRLDNPPDIMFAGDTIFQLLFGSILVSLPTSCSSLLGSAVAPSLYK